VDILDSFFPVSYSFDLFIPGAVRQRGGALALARKCEALERKGRGGLGFGVGRESAEALDGQARSHYSSGGALQHGEKPCGTRLRMVLGLGAKRDEVALDTRPGSCTQKAWLLLTAATLFEKRRTT
jgi:hypothetical protein